MAEEVKSRRPANPSRVPVWYRDGNICHPETFTDHVWLTFLKGASLEDSKDFFNARLEGNALRALVIHEGDDLAEEDFKPLIRAAGALNASSARG